MKRIIHIFMLLLVTGMSLPVALAAEGETTTVTTQAAVDTDGVDAATVAEIEAMDTDNGKEMRLLQLQHQIELKATQGRAVIARLENGMNITANQSRELEAIVEQLDALAEDVEDVISDIENQTNQETVDAFLAIKAEAKDLVAQFRVAVHAITEDNKEEREELRVRIREERTDDQERIESRIQNLRAEHNAVRAQAMLDAMGIINAELIAEIRSGALNAEELRERLKARFEEIEGETREDAAERLREELAKRKVARAALITEFKSDMVEKREMILREQIDRIDNEVAKERLRARLSILEEDGNLSDMRLRTETRIREAGNDMRIEIRERVKDGETERRERLRLEDEIRIDDIREIETRTRLESDDSSVDAEIEVRT